MSRFFIDRPIFAWVLAIVAMLAGALSLVKMPIPINSSRRRPKPSPRRPTLTINVVIVNR